MSAQRRRAEEISAALLLQNQQRTLDGAHGFAAHIAVSSLQFLGAVCDIGQQGLQILHVEQQQAFFIGQPEGDIEHAFLRVGQVHQPRQEQRPHFGNGGADRMALFAEKIPENHREFLVFVRVKADRVGAFDQKILLIAHGGDARKVALDVGCKYRHAGIGKPFGEDLQRHRFAGAGRAGHQAMAVAEFQVEIFRPLH